MEEQVRERGERVRMIEKIRWGGKEEKKKKKK